MNNKNNNLTNQIVELETWLDHAEKLARHIAARAKELNTLSVFTVASTSKSVTNRLPFFTPIRSLSQAWTAGSVVFSQTQAVLLCRRIDGLVDYILVDAEKKIEATMSPDRELKKHFGFDDESLTKTHVYFELGNISAACNDQIKKSKYREFKPNDMTVEAAWLLISSTLGGVSGKKAAIIGCGNIGFKVALRLVESGCMVNICRRSLEKGMLQANVINIIKNASTLANATYNSDPLYSTFFADIIVGCTAGVPVINSTMIQVMKKNGLVVDIGKGCILPDAIEKAAELEVPVIRCDITSALDGVITAIIRNDLIMEKLFGRHEVASGLYLVSGGYMGRKGDIIVDNYLDPTRIIGIANGSGDILEFPTSKDKEGLEKVRQIIENREK